MKKTKKAIIAAVAIIIAGLIIGCIGMSALGWDFYRLDTNEYVEKTWTNEQGEQVDTVRIDSYWRIKVTKGDELSLKYYETKNRTSEISVADGILSIDETRTLKWFKLFDFSFRYVWELTVPDGINLQFDSTNTDIEIGGIALGTLSVDSTNADITLRDVTATQISIDSTNLDLDITGVTAGAITANSTNCDIDIGGAGLSADSLTAKGTNLDINLSGGSVREINVKATNLDIDVEGVAADRVFADGTNVNADLAIRGNESEYSVRVSKTNGSGPAERDGTDENKLISLSGRNLDADLTFVS